MMENFVYTTLGRIAALAREQWLLTGSKSSFDQLSRSIVESGEYSVEPPPFAPSDMPLEPEDFRRHAYESPVPVNITMEACSEIEVPRSNLIPVSHEVLSGIELPYAVMPLHRVDIFQIKYVCTGSCVLNTQQGTRRYPAGSLILLAPHQLGSVTVEGESIIMSIYIHPPALEQSLWHLLGKSSVLSDFFRCALYGRSSTGFLTFSLDEPAPYLALFQQVFDEAQFPGDEYANTIAVSVLNILFARLVRDFGESVRVIDGGDALVSHTEFPAILRYVQYHFNTVTLPELAAVFHFSEAYISRMFRQHMNQSFSAMLQSIKLQRAKRYLMYSDYSVGEIASLVGYDAPEYLARIFRKSFGQTPSEFRRTNKSE